MLRTTRSCELQELSATRASALQLRFARQSAWENLTRQDLTPPPQPSIHLKPILNEVIQPRNALHSSNTNSVESSRRKTRPTRPPTSSAILGFNRGPAVEGSQGKIFPATRGDSRRAFP